jgi:hypothetical protein
MDTHRRKRGRQKMAHQSTPPFATLYQHKDSKWKTSTVCHDVNATVKQMKFP